MKPETALKKIARIFERKRQVKLRGVRAKVTESTDAYFNLEGAIVSIEYDGNRVDRASRKTLARVARQLGKIREVLRESGHLKD